MKTTQKKIYMLIAGILLYGIGFCLKCMHIFNSRWIVLCLSLMHYGGSYPFSLSITSAQLTNMRNIRKKASRRS